MMSDNFEELHWFCSESGDREAFVYYDNKEYYVKMVEVETGGKGGDHDIHHVKEIRTMGKDYERDDEECERNWGVGGRKRVGILVK